MTMEPSKNPDPFAAELEDAAMRLYHPGSRPHPVPWAPDDHGRLHIGVSTLVKNSATSHAEYIISKTEEVDEADGFYGEQGNALAEHHLRQITPHRENQVRLKIDEDYDMVGHVDGISQGAFGLSIREHKHQDPDQGDPSGNIDLAERQALLYASMAEEMFKQGRIEFHPSPLMPTDATVAPCGPVWGIVLHFWPRNEPKALVKARRVEAWEKAAVLDRYMRKAKAIIASVRAGNTDAAMAWDTSPEGVTEFKITASAASLGLPEVPLLVATLQADLAATYEKQWNAEKRKAQAAVLAQMAAADVRKMTLSDPSDPKKVWAAPSFRSNAGGTTWLVPNLRGDWSTERIVSTIEELTKPKVTA